MFCAAVARARPGLSPRARRPSSRIPLSPSSQTTELPHDRSRLQFQCVVVRSLASPTGSPDLHSFGLLTASIHSHAPYSGTSLLNNTISRATPIASPETPPQASRSYKHRSVSTLAPTLLGPRPRANDYISSTLLDPVTADSAAAALERGNQPT